MASDWQDGYDPALGAALRFSPADLTRNRDGELTPAQVRRLHHDLRWVYWPVIGGASGFAFFVGTTSLLAGSFALVPVVFLLLVATAAAVVLFVQRENLPLREVHESVLDIGRLALTAHRWGLVDDDPMGRVQFKVDGGRRVFAPRGLVHAMRPNQRYFIYYARLRTWSGCRILSIEPADGMAPVGTRRKAKRKRTHD